MYRRETDDGYFEITDAQRMFIIREHKAELEKKRYRRNRDLRLVAMARLVAQGHEDEGGGGTAA